MDRKLNQTSRSEILPIRLRSGQAAQDDYLQSSRAQSRDLGATLDVGDRFKDVRRVCLESVGGSETVKVCESLRDPSTSTV
jgi:hypothetical protein